MTTRAILPWCVGALLIVSPSAAPGAVLEGRCLDGEASTAALREKQARGERWQGGDESWFVPVAGQEIRVQRLDAPGVWSATTDDEGRFRIDVGPSSLPEGARVTAISGSGDGARFSATATVTAEPLVLFVYPPSESTEDALCEIVATHDIVDHEGERWLRVRVRAIFYGISGRLFVGAKGGSSWREIARLPLPDRSVVTRNTGPVAGLRWKQSTDGRWLVVDEPVAGLADTARQLSGAATPREWIVEYLTPPSQILTLRYPISMRCQGFTVYALHDDMKVEARGIQQMATSVTDDPGSRAEGSFDRYEVSERLAGGQRVDLAVQISNTAIGQISRRSLKWHGSFVLVALLAMLAGILLGQRGPRLDRDLEGLTAEQAVDRLVALDRRRTEGKIKASEYQRYREALRELAAAKLPDSPADGPPPVQAPAPDAPAALPAEASDLVRRLEALEGATEATAIQERAHLLEALYRCLRKEPPR